MPHVVTSNCVGHTHRDCVAVCPVDAFRESNNYLIIDPNECIDCGACSSECPVDAIYSNYDVPKQEVHWIEINAQEAIDARSAHTDAVVLVE